jgi:hypothetical protein
VAHAIEHVQHRREVHVDFVGEAIDAGGDQFVAGNVWMVAARELPVRALDLISARVAGNPEDVVVVAHAGITLPCRPMADVKDCPLCGDTMRLKLSERSDSVPGTGQVTKRQVREWECPECDYWEEAESNEG